MSDVVQCAVANCPVAKDRRCMEGLTPETCPHFGKPAASVAPADAEESDADSDAESSAAIVEEGYLVVAQTLSRTEANVHFCAQHSHCIALLGPNEAGKTSLIAAIYDQLQEGQFAGWAYKWCDTLHGFEIACHHSRLASHRDIPYTERTKMRADLRYYHLALRRAAEDLNILFADRAGESYGEAANVPSRAAEFQELRRADTITLLLDGAKLIHPGQRHGAKSNLTMMLQGIVDSGIIVPLPRLAVVLTKFDLVSAYENAAAALEEFRQFADGLRNRFGSHFADVRRFEIASSPTDVGEILRGHGLEALFNYWISDTPAFVASIELKPSARQFQQLRVLAQDAAL